MPIVTCVECAYPVQADHYVHSVTRDPYGLLSLCSECALKRLREARERGAGDKTGPH